MKIKEYEEILYERNFEASQDKREELGNYIKGLREEKGISLTQLADLSKINVSDLHKIEHGTKNKVNPFQLKALSKILQVDYKDLYKIINFLEKKDFNNKFLESEKNYSREELISILSMFYPKIDLKLLLDNLEKFSVSEIKEVFSFVEFLMQKK